jgi:hypothetical protein
MRALFLLLALAMVFVSASAGAQRSIGRESMTRLAENPPSWATFIITAFFLHFWVNNDATKLAMGLRSALDGGESLIEGDIRK